MDLVSRVAVFPEETKCNFPDDLVSEILSALPVRQLLRFRCVSKSWCAIIDNPRFISKHHKRLHAILKEQGDIPMFVSTVECSWRFDLSSLEDLGTQLHFVSKRYAGVLLSELRGFPPNTHYTKQFPYVSCLGCANGVVLFEWNCTGLGLWNPATREFKVVPRVPRFCKEYWCDNSTLLCDPMSTDIKIITQISRVTEHNPRLYFCCEIYSLKTNSWRSIEYPSHPEHDLSNGPDYGGDVNINNIHYWTYYVNCHVDPRRLKPPKSKFIVSFNICNETFQFLSLPSIEGRYVCYLGNYNGSLACICNRGIRVPLEIWVMNEVDDHGILSAWQHLFSIGPFGQEFVSFCSIRVGGDILLALSGYIRTNNDGTIETTGPNDGCLYDPATKKITMRFGFGFTNCFEYVENLLRLTN